ncbi:ribonuclease P protein subunit p40 [Biomphalaria pfeifferi]|uniref:Ribonuclease P protein subunit p40 n=1 Tax=Biomphalaria pfeifferi TaxID=112525 RepID=A0AAD8AWT6_BIOPF|nr:ribonuclease P protein subunit p40 [Biomphalaria pfeifferi]
MAASIKKSTFILEKITLDYTQKDLRRIQEQNFTQTLSLVLPGENVVPNFVQESLTNQFTYKLHMLPLFCLIEMPFVQAFVKKGAINLMSVNRKLDTDDSVVITPNGVLLLSLTKDTFQQLGLEAVKQTPTQRKQDIYVVKINLLHKSFRPGKKGYNRTLWCLKDRLDLVMDCLVSWEPHDEKLCSSSVGVYFVDKCDKVERFDLKQTTHQYTSLQCPKIDSNHPTGSEIGCNFRDFFEWLGAIACNIPTNESGDPYISTWACPEPNTNIPRCCLFQATGMITAQAIVRLWKSLRHHTAQTHNYPVCLTLHGFPDSIMKNKHEFNNFYIAGDNLYTFVLLPENCCWLYKASGS